MSWLSGSEGLRLFLEFLIKSTAVLACAILFASLLRKRSASLRHFVLTFFLVGLLFLPALTSFRFGWETGLLPAPAADAVRYRLVQGGPAAGTLLGETDVPVGPIGPARVMSAPGLTDSSGQSLPLYSLESEINPLPGLKPAVFPGLILSGAYHPVLKTGLSRRERINPFPGLKPAVFPGLILSGAYYPVLKTGLSRRERIGGPGYAAAPPLPSPEGAAVRTARIAFPMIWAAGLALILLRLALGLRGAFRLTREGEFVRDPAWRVLLERLLAMLGLRRTIRLKAHDDVIVPLTWGVFRPVILIPAGYEDWTDGQRSSALLHELSHIKRADFLVMMLVRLSLAVFWFNPLAWIAFGMMKKEQEKACDELVLRTGLKPSTYAANLLLFRSAAGMSWDPSAALLGIAGKSSLNERLAAILKQKLTFKEVGMKTKLMIGIVAVLAVSVIGIARPETASAATSNVSTLTGPVALGLVEDITPMEQPVVQADEPAMEAAPTEAGRNDSPRIEAQTADVSQAQEKEKQEKEKAKEETVRSIVISTKDGKNVPIEITIVRDDGQKTIKIDKSVVLKKDADGNFFLVSPEGEEIEVLKGDQIHLQIKEGNIEVLEGGKVLKVAEGGTLRFIKEKDKGHVAYAIKEGKEGKAVAYHFVPEGAEKGGDIYITKGEVEFIGEDAGKNKVEIMIGSGKGGKEIAWIGKGDIEPRVVVDELEVKPRIAFVGKGDPRAHVMLEAVTDVKPRIAWTVKEDEQELRKKLEELRATLEKVKAKELDLSALEKALDKMEAELKENEEFLKTVDVHLAHEPIAYSVIRKADKEGDVAVWVGEGDAPRPVTITTGNKGDFSMAIAFGVQEMSREVYDKVVENVKKELPEGYEIESDFESGTKKKSGIITLKIKGPDDKTGVSTELAKKLADALKEAIKKEATAKK